MSLSAQVSISTNRIGRAAVRIVSSVMSVGTFEAFVGRQCQTTLLGGPVPPAWWQGMRGEQYQTGYTVLRPPHAFPYAAEAPPALDAERRTSGALAIHFRQHHQWCRRVSGAIANARVLARTGCNAARTAAALVPRPDHAICGARARGAGADDVGITRVQPQWVYGGCTVKEQFAISVCVQHDWAELKTAPEEAAAAEVIRQYGRGIRVAKAVASFLREQGHEAAPHGGPLAMPMLLLPAAIKAGLGELGKHGS